MEYATWRAQAAAALKRLHGIGADQLPERLWKQLYVQNSTPREAADHAWRYYTNARPASERAG